jgi:hypothetical protein
MSISVNKTLMLDHFPTISATAPLDSGMAIRQTSVPKGSIILFSIYVLFQLYQIISLSSSSLQNIENPT